ncbi:hypothetical protein L3X38_045132 [Prunus dulcis]|uniref:Uncharacterized protein n=1 Tax=Prunus dulcis TaxID=3755 RepID=A0AAD4V1F0_PRUDU|nr:hypothetical protein L3X38_045132 [Prunus dulcis]
MLYASVRETPKLTRGSSSFSPGEAFWDDAIQLDDGLCAQAVGVISVARCDCKSKEILDEGGEQSESSLIDRRGKDMTSYSPVDEVAKLTGNHESNEACTPSSFVPLKDHLDLNSWQQPEICSLYRKKGISKLYPWQVDYLQVEVCIADKESCILRINKCVRSYVGNQGGGTLPKDTSVAVCTKEKANFLIKRLLEEGRLSEIGIIVIDEQAAGVMTKLRYAAGEGNSESSSGESSGMSSCNAYPVMVWKLLG